MAIVSPAVKYFYNAYEPILINVTSGNYSFHESNFNIVRSSVQIRTFPGKSTLETGVYSAFYSANAILFETGLSSNV